MYIPIVYCSHKGKTSELKGTTLRKEIKMTVYGRRINDDDMNMIASYMDDEIREALHSELAPCTHEEFIAAYLERDPEFIAILRSEFDFDED